MNPEVDKFDRLAAKWWDIDGPFATLHQINPVRLEYILRQVGGSVMGMDVLDLGCGGGIVSVPLARLGANVMGIDAGPGNIQAAQKKKSSANFICATSRQFIEQYPDRKFDLVLCLELIEHVDDPLELLCDAATLLKPNGRLILSTLNKTWKAYALGIVVAERLLGMIPPGTHQFDKFLTPYQLALIAEQADLVVRDITGFAFDIFKKKWHLSRDISINYLVTLQHATIST